MPQDKYSPVHWRSIRINPDGAKFRLCLLYSHDPLTQSYLEGVGVKGTPRLSGLTLQEAKDIGEPLEKVINQNARKGK